MSGASVLLRVRRRESVQPWPDRRTKTEESQALRDAAARMAKYAQHPDVAASALACLDHADQLDVSPRCGWYPRRPAGWRP